MFDSAKREVRLGLPTRASLHKALQWVRGQEAWLEKQLAALPDGIALVQGAVFPFEGSDVRIDWSPLAARRVMLGEGCLMLGGAEEAIAPRVLRWLRDRARETLHHETRSEEHTSELQSLMRISYAVFCLKKKNTRQ